LSTFFNLNKQIFGINFFYIFFMGDAAVFWEQVKKEIKQQNTTQEWVAKKAGISFNTLQGWISKGIYPRVNDAVRIAGALNTSVEYLVAGAVRDNTAIIETISRHVPEIHKRLDIIMESIKHLE
jgi:transcriptional regulator with XRE-family HTH domain